MRIDDDGGDWRDSLRRAAGAVLGVMLGVGMALGAAGFLVVSFLAVIALLGLLLVAAACAAPFAALMVAAMHFDEQWTVPGLQKWKRRRDVFMGVK